MTDSSTPAPRRVVLAHIICATHLPMPNLIHFNGGILQLSFDTVAEGERWTEDLKGKRDSRVYQGFRYVDQGIIDWYGWSLQIHASEPAEMAARS